MPVMMERMATAGTVRSWHDEEGWGVVDSAATPGGCWAHFSAVAVPAFRSLEAGQLVELEWERARQDGYAFRAVRVWPRGREPYEAPDDNGPVEGTGAYWSALTTTIGEAPPTPPAPTGEGRPAKP